MTEHLAASTGKDDRSETASEVYSGELDTSDSDRSELGDSSTEALVSNRWPIFGGVVLVAAAAIIAAGLGANPWLTATAAIVATLITALRMSKAEASRAEERIRLFRSRQNETNRWRQRWSELNDESQQSTTALSQMMDGVIMLSNDSEILLINDSALRLLGLSKQGRFLGRSFTEIVRIPETTQAVRATCDGGGAQVANVEISDDKGIRPIRVYVDRIGDRQDSHVLITLRDETETHRVETMRRDFVANVSHEIKTPIAAIKGYVETAELAIEDDTQAAKHFMSQIHGQCLRLERLVADMMQIARAQSGEKNLRKTAVSFDDIVSESLRSLRPVAKSKSIDLDVKDLSNAIVFADHDATLAIANNLISNAIHYSPNDTTVTISGRREDHYWVLSVQDNGVGIAESEQERIFERFYRIDRNRTSASGGTGIGLSIVKNLTVAQEGKIRLHSSAGKGSTFEVLLPVFGSDSVSDQSVEEKTP